MEISEKIKTGEFCFQFDEEEIVVVNDVFDYGETQLILASSKEEPSPSIEFEQNGKKFKIFIKPMMEGDR